jgi:phosphatidate phosphatase LPIN
VFGQILPIIGKDWSHSGVVQLYSNIKSNGYQILYLTARPIGQANMTRGYVSTLKQGDIIMPAGPVLMSPSRLLSAFNQEVILRRPEEFKIACLKDIRDLFPKHVQPFYAGFGNRPTVSVPSCHLRASITKR